MTDKITKARNGAMMTFIEADQEPTEELLFLTDEPVPGKRVPPPAHLRLIPQNGSEPQE